MRPLRQRLHDIIFQHDEPAERAFDVVLIVAILLSVLVVMLDSVESISAAYGDVLYAAEWFFTILFTVEYLLRLWTAKRPLAYARSFYGVVDLLSVLPTWLSILFPPGRFLVGAARAAGAAGVPHPQAGGIRGAGGGARRRRCGPAATRSPCSSPRSSRSRSSWAR